MTILDTAAEFITSNWPLVTLVATVGGMYYGYLRGYRTGYDDGFEADYHERRLRKYGISIDTEDSE